MKHTTFSSLRNSVPQLWGWETIQKLNMANIFIYQVHCGKIFTLAWGSILIPSEILERAKELPPESVSYLNQSPMRARICICMFFICFFVFNLKFCCFLCDHVFCFVLYVYFVLCAVQFVIPCVPLCHVLFLPRSFCFSAPWPTHSSLLSFVMSPGVFHYIHMPCSLFSGSSHLHI